MFNIFELVDRAFTYAKNHKTLWFFGIFLTSWGGLSFIRRIDFNETKAILHLSRFEEFIDYHPERFALWVVLGVCATLTAFFIGAVARAVIIRRTAELETEAEEAADKGLPEHVEKQLDILQILKKTRKTWANIFLLGFVVNVIMFLVLVFLLAPLYILFSRGLTNQTVIFALAALAIYFPIVVILSLVNVFAGCYIVLYGLSPMKAVRAAFDLLGLFFDKVVALFLVLAIIYAISWILSFMLFGTVSGLLFVLRRYAGSLAIPGFFVIIVAVLLALGALLLVINAFLNVFTNVTWTLFFIRMIRAERVGKARKELAQANMGG